MKNLSFKTIGHFTDILILNVSFILSFIMRFGLDKSLFVQKQIFLYFLINIFWILGIIIVRPYRQEKTGFNVSRLLWRLLLVLLIHLFLICLYYVFTKNFTYSRFRLSYFYLIIFLAGSLSRISGVYFIRKFRRRGFFIRKYAIVGLGKKVKSIERFYQNHPELGMNLQGKYDIETFFDENNLSSILKAKVHVAYLMMQYMTSESLEKAIKILHANRIKVKVLMDFNSFLEREVSVDYHDYLPVFNVASSPAFNLEEAFIKRFFDLIFAFGVMILGFPCFFILGVITKFSSKGPIFYKSERIGYGGQKFYIYKFRSMVVNADEIALKLLGGNFHSQGSDDPRITKWGRFIRKTRLDELPQFWNVLTGEMSIVGPRPLPKYDVDMILEASEDKYHRLLMMKPGLTSLGQIRVGYATTERENVQRMNMDLLYHRNYSFWNDIWLIVKTTQLMVDGKGK